MKETIVQGMEGKFQNKYLLASARLQAWDYRWAAVYFITICTHDRYPYFGEIQNGKMILSHAGVLADVLWHEIKNHTNHVELPAFVVMPNHVHGIFILHETDADVPNVETLQCNVSTTNPGKDEFMSRISPKRGSVSAIIRSYRSAVARHAHRLGYKFAWQTRFHDHIIHNEKTYYTVYEYILNNAEKWAEDKFYYDRPV